MNRQAIAMGVIRTARRLAANTPLQRLPFTGFLYRKVFRYGYTGDVVTADFRGLRLTAPTKDATIVPGLVGGFYEVIELDLFERLAASSRTIVDVGGNIGLYACLASRTAPDGARVVSFEPIPENLEYLRRNLAQNGADGVTLEECAVGEREGSITIYTSRQSIGTHSASAQNAGNAEGREVPMTSVDAYTAANGVGPVDLLKVDVEGYDGFVLRGAERVLSEDGPALFVELVPSHLKNCGFEPRDFVELLFGHYDDVWMVNEPRHTITPCTRQDLLALGDRQVNANLVLVRRPEHRDAVAAYVRELAAA